MSNTVNNRVAPVPSFDEQTWATESFKQRRQSIIREFALTTSTHGLPGIARSQTKHNRIFWTLSFLIFIAVMIFFVYQSIYDYFQYPTQTSISIVAQRSQAFPAVTFCNYSPARFDQIIRPLLNYTNSMNLTNTNDTSTFTPEQAQLLLDFLQQRVNAGESVDEYFFSLDLMLMNCSYNDEQCTSDDFISFISSSYGRCYTFNAERKDGNATNIRYTNDYGGFGKLQLRLYAQSQLYVPYISGGSFNNAIKNNLFAFFFFSYVK